MYVGEMDNWAATTNRMAARNLLTAIDARTLLPTAATLPEWDGAQASATAFWTEAAGDTRVSDGFRAIAAANSRHTRLSS